MIFTICVTPPALIDIDEALNYYNSKVADLGYKFADEVENSIQAILRNPYAFSERYKNTRAKLLNKFPYLVMFSINYEEQTIIVLRVFNTYQNPYWL
jgi:toxin ParE1/3/4